MKKIIVFIAFSLSLFGSDLLQIHRKLVPMTLLQVNSIAKKADKTINIYIISNENELLKAHEFKTMLPKKIKSFKINPTVVEESNIDELFNDDIDAIYTFSLSDLSYTTIHSIITQTDIVTFSNLYTGLKKGMLIFIDKKKKIKLYMNSKMMKLQKIPFNNRFLSIVKLVDE